MIYLIAFAVWWLIGSVLMCKACMDEFDELTFITLFISIIGGWGWPLYIPMITGNAFVIWRKK